MCVLHVPSVPRLSSRRSRPFCSSVIGHYIDSDKQLIYTENATQNWPSTSCSECYYPKWITKIGSGSSSEGIGIWRKSVFPPTCASPFVHIYLILYQDSVSANWNSVVFHIAQPHSVWAFNGKRLRKSLKTHFPLRPATVIKKAMRKRSWRKWAMRARGGERVWDPERREEARWRRFLIAKKRDSSGRRAGRSRRAMRSCGSRISNVTDKKKKIRKIG